MAYYTVKTKMKTATERTAELTRAIYFAMESIKEELKALRYILPRESTWQTAQIERNVPYAVSFIGEFGLKCFLFVNTLDGKVKKLTENVLGQQTEPSVTPEPTQPKTTEAKTIEDVAKEWWIAKKVSLLEYLDASGGEIEVLDLDKNWAIPDPKILPFVRKWLSKETKGGFYFDSIDDDCNGTIVCRIEVSEEKAGAVEKFNRRQAKKRKEEAQE